MGRLFCPVSYVKNRRRNGSVINDRIVEMTTSAAVSLGWRSEQDDSRHGPDPHLPQELGRDLNGAQDRKDQTGGADGHHEGAHEVGIEGSSQLRPTPAQGDGNKDRRHHIEQLMDHGITILSGSAAV
jgi:hypothetical protein